MGTDESIPESDRFARVREQVSAPDTGGIGTSGVRERLQWMAVRGVQSVQHHERSAVGDSMVDRVAVSPSAGWATRWQPEQSVPVVAPCEGGVAT
jgi:hypothetical protein